MEQNKNDKNYKAYQDHRAKRNRKTILIYGSPYSPTSQSHIERAQKSLRDRIRALVVKKGNFKYLPDLQRLVNNYNTTKHSSTGYSPNELYQRKQYETVSGKTLAKEPIPEFRDDFTKEERITYVSIKKAHRLFKTELDLKKREKEKELKKGDKVRVSLKAFSNKVREMYKLDNIKYLNVLYTPDVFTIDKIVQKRTSTKRGKYSLKNMDGTVFDGYGTLATRRKTFYKNELLKINVFLHLYIKYIRFLKEQQFGAGF